MQLDDGIFLDRISNLHERDGAGCGWLIIGWNGFAEMTLDSSDVHTAGAKTKTTSGKNVRTDNKGALGTWTETRMGIGTTLGGGHIRFFESVSTSRALTVDDNQADGCWAKKGDTTTLITRLHQCWLIVGATTIEAIYVCSTLVPELRITTITHNHHWNLPSLLP